MSDTLLPEVSGGFGDAPELTFPQGVSAPQGLRVQVLHAGNGPVVRAGQELEVNYHGQIWGGEVFDSSYRRGAPAQFPIGVGMVIQGWDQALVGQQVGSRIVMAVPPNKGYGANGHPGAGIKGTDVLVFVVDILAAR